MTPNYLNTSSASLEMTDYPLVGVVRVTWPAFKSTLR